MPINNRQNYSFLQDYNNLDVALQIWGEGYLGKEDFLHVAIARKAPRLLEWVCQNGVDSNGIPVVTELALPFLDWNKINKVLVADEAIYHGTTFEKVLALISNIKENLDSIEAAPVVTTTDALNSKLIANALVEGTSIINQSAIPFYVDTIISKFYDLGKPYDVEYPLFYIDFKKEIKNEDIEKILKRLAQTEAVSHSISEDAIDYYSVSNYYREKNTKNTSFTYITDYLTSNSAYGLAVPDFSKLRFFKKGKRLCIASISPYTIPEHYITEDAQMFVGELLKVWNLLYKKARENARSFNDNRSQWYKSMVMTSNYLLSFAHFLQLRQNLLLAMQDEVIDKRFYLRLEDIQYLFGLDMSQQVLEILESIDCLESNRSFFCISSGGDSIIPSDYVQQYNYQIALDNLRDGQTKSVSLMISSIFSAMHWQVEFESRNKGRDDYKRLSFGESYNSMINRLGSSSSFSTLELSRLVHRCIDERIDKGTVVPGYVRNHHGVYSEWVRLFRSGENEDVYKDQLFRIVLSIVSRCFELSNTQFISRASFEYILTIIYLLQRDRGCAEKEIKEILDKDIFGIPLVPVFDRETNMYAITIDVDGQYVGIVDYALTSEIVKVDNFGNLSFSSSTYAQRLSSGCVLDGKVLEEINKIISFVIAYDKKIFGDSDDTRELLNYFFYLDKNIDLRRLVKEGKKELAKMIEEDNGSLSQLNQLSKLFSEIFLRFPDFRFGLDEQEYANSKLYKYLNDIYESINEQLQDRKMFYEVSFLDIPLNLWTYYKNHTTLDDFDEEYYTDYINWVESDNSPFMDKTGCASWLKINTSFQGILNCSALEVKQRLIELLNISKFDE